MPTKFKRTPIFAFLILVISCCALSAQEKESASGEIAKLRARLDALEMKTDGDIEVEPKMLTRGKWVSSFDILTMTVRDSAFEYGVTDIGGVQDRGVVGTVLSLGGNYSSGIRLSFGRQIGSNGPVVSFRHLNFFSNASESVAGALRATVVSSDNNENNDSDNTSGTETVTPDDRATSVDALHDFSLRTFDIELAQAFNVSDALDVKVNSAIRIADVDSYQEVTYRGGDFQTAFTPFQESFFDGAGVVLGGQMTWKFSNWLSLQYGLSGGALLGRMQTRTFIPDDEPGVPTDLTYSETRLTPLIETRVALMFHRQIGRFHVDLGGGYEFANMFNLADQRVFTDSHIEAQNAHLVGDLSMDGFFTRVTIRR